jgi:aldose 1-epimerase
MNNKMKNTTKDLEIVELTNSNGITVKITNFGASIVSILVPDKNGTVGEVVLGYDNPKEYITGNLYFGATIGRFGNRIANGKFTLDGDIFTLVKNNGNIHLHGGNVGFNNVIWEVQDYKNNNDQHFIKLHYLSPDGEEGYPGNLNTWVTYTLTNNNEIVIDYLAETDKKTVINLTHHSFFNLKDGGKSNILDHEIMINANFFTPVNDEIITTGELRSVVATPMDFNETTRIGLHIEDDYEQLKLGRGYDHNWVINRVD